MMFTQLHNVCGKQKEKETGISWDKIVKKNLHKIFKTIHNTKTKY